MAKSRDLPGKRAECGVGDRRRRAADQAMVGSYALAARERINIILIIIITTTTTTTTTIIITRLWSAYYYSINII